MEVKISSKFNVGDTLNTEVFGKVKIIKIKLVTSSTNSYQFQYLIELENESRTWESEHQVARLRRC